MAEPLSVGEFRPVIHHGDAEVHRAGQTGNALRDMPGAEQYEIIAADHWFDMKSFLSAGDYGRFSQMAAKLKQYGQIPAADHIHTVHCFRI